jgi:hypothetical protein
VTARTRSTFDAFCREAFGFLDSSGVRHLVIGGLAVVAVGEARTTADVDVVAFLSEEAAEQLILDAQKRGFELDAELERHRLHTTGTLRFRRGAFQLDVILASLPFEEEAYQRASRHSIFGRPVLLPSPEDLILFKLLAGREKDLLDAMGVARRHAKRIDWAYVEGVLRALCDLAEDMTPWRRLEELRAKLAHPR